MSEKEWLAARKALLVKEKKFTRLRDQLNQQRRNLTWEKVGKDLSGFVHAGGNKERDAVLQLRQIQNED